METTPTVPTTLENGPSAFQTSGPAASPVSVSLVPPPTDPTKPGPQRLPKGYLSEALGHAERLLNYAAEAGIEVDDGIQKSILKAKASTDGGMDEETAFNLRKSLTQLAAKLRPVTAESLETCSKAPRSPARSYMVTGIILMAIIRHDKLVAALTSVMNAAKAAKDLQAAVKDDAEDSKIADAAQKLLEAISQFKDVVGDPGP